MKRKVLLATALAFITLSMFASLSVMPVLAKPYTITVIVKNAEGKPAANNWVTCAFIGVSGGWLGGQTTDSRGKAVFTVPSSADNSWLGELVLQVTAYAYDGGPMVGQKYDTLNSKFSARVTVNYFP